MNPQEVFHASDLIHCRDTPSVSAVRRCLMRAAGAALVALIGGACASAQLASVSSKVRVKYAALNGGAWRVRGADFVDGFQGVQGRILVQNISPAPSGIPPLYAEYFDATGQRCFSLTFVQDRNLQKRVGQFLPQETRTLYSSAYYEAPAVEPEELAIYPMGGSGGQAPIRLPPRLEEGSAANPSWDRMDLPQGVFGQNPGPIADIALAKVDLDDAGSPQGASISEVPNSEIAGWFEIFIRHQRFRPAEANALPRAGAVLLLVRALVSLRCIQQKPFPPRDSPLVRHYVQALSLPELPVVVSVLLEPCSIGQSWPRVGCYHVVSIGSGFEAPSAGLTLAEGQGRSAIGPVLRKIIAPPGSIHCP